MRKSKSNVGLSLKISDQFKRCTADTKIMSSEPLEIARFEGDPQYPNAALNIRRTSLTTLVLDISKDPYPFDATHAEIEELPEIVAQTTIDRYYLWPTRTTQAAAKIQISSLIKSVFGECPELPETLIPMVKRNLIV